MNVSIFAGKGGVGKSTSTAAYALSRAEKVPTLVIDYDGGHSITRVLGLSRSRYSTPNKIMKTLEIDDLSLAVVESREFKPIRQTKSEGLDVKKYLAQFKGNYGLLPFHDMITEFFGAVTDMHSVSYFAALTTLFEEARKSGIRQIAIDVEPTAGLERMLSSTEAITRSFRNLQNLGAVKKTLLGQAWPDIRAFLDGGYIKNAENYASELETTAAAIKGADYHLVCIPESSPVEQMREVKQIVESYGGRVVEFIVNNIREKSYEIEHIKKVNNLAEGCPVVHTLHNPELHGHKYSEQREILKEIGRRFVQ